MAESTIYVLARTFSPRSRHVTIEYAHRHSNARFTAECWPTADGRFIGRFTSVMPGMDTAGVAAKAYLAACDAGAITGDTFDAVVAALETALRQACDVDQSRA